MTKEVVLRLLPPWPTCHAGHGPDAPRRGFTMSYDPQTDEWGAYDGPLANRGREVRLEADAALRSAG